ncbi:unnamed protein product [Ixodes pacificus]
MELTRVCYTSFLRNECLAPQGMCAEAVVEVPGIKISELMGVNVVRFYCIFTIVYRY